MAIHPTDPSEQPTGKPGEPELPPPAGDGSQPAGAGPELPEEPTVPGAPIEPHDPTPSDPVEPDRGPPADPDEVRYRLVDDEDDGVIDDIDLDIVPDDAGYLDDVPLHRPYDQGRLPEQRS